MRSISLNTEPATSVRLFIGFNRRFHLETIPLRLLVAAATIGPRPACWLRQAEESY